MPLLDKPPDTSLLGLKGRSYDSPGQRPGRSCHPLFQSPNGAVLKDESNWDRPVGALVFVVPPNPGRALRSALGCYRVALSGLCSDQLTETT